MLDSKNSFPMHLYEPVQPAPHPSAAGPDAAHLLLTVRRGRRFIAVCVAVFVAFAIGYLILETPLYEASSAIIIDTATSKMMQNQGAQGIPPDDTIDSNLVDSEVEVLSSDGFATRVIRSLHLAQDPEFVGPPDRLMARIVNFVMTTFNDAKKLVGLNGVQIDDPEQRALTVFNSRLKVKRSALTYVIGINFSSEDRNKAAKIANAVASTYLQVVLEAKYAAARETEEWLQTRLTDMRVQAQADDRAVQEFKSQNNIVDTNRGLMNEQQLADLNSQLVVAQSASAEAKAKRDTVRAVMADPEGSSTVSDAITNPVISRLQAQYLDLANRAGDLTQRFGPNHGAVLDLRQQMNQIKGSMQSELKRISDSYDSDYTVALARENSLRTSLKKMVSSDEPSNVAQVKLKDLESSADTSRALLNGYLQKVQEASQLQTFPISDARIITEAVSPLKPSNPKAWLVLAIGVLGGFGIGAGATITRELATKSFRTGDEVEAFTGLKFLGFLPFVRANAKSRRTSKTEDAPREGEASFRNPVDVYVLDAPYSRFAETIRSVKIAIDAMNGGTRGGKVIGIVSAGPNEGKTTVASNLAATLAMNGGRALLIDCDVRTRALSLRLGADQKIGLMEVVADPDRCDAALLHDRESGMFVLPCAPKGKTFAAAEILGGDRMQVLLERLRTRFDYIILDIAPAVPVVDARALSKHLDGFVFVIRWATTSRKMVQEAIAMDELHSRLIGTVVSQVDTKALREIETYRGPDFSKYYQE